MPNKKLPIKQELFCQEYIIDYNGVEAYIRAGYKAKNRHVAAVQANKLLTKPDIAKKINDLKAQREEKLKVDAEWVLKEAVDLYKMAKGEKAQVYSRYIKPEWVDIEKMPTQIQDLIFEEMESAAFKVWEEETLSKGVQIRKRLDSNDNVLVQVWKEEEWKKEKVHKTNLREANKALEIIGKHVSVKAFEKELDLGDNIKIKVIAPAGFED